MTFDAEALKPWIGRRETRKDKIRPAHVADLAAVLDRSRAPKSGEPLPIAWHWAFFHRFVRPGDLGSDGHPKRGGFLPPIEPARRMWAGGRIKVLADLPVNATATRESEILKIAIKQGRSGQLGFVTVRHVIKVDGTVAIDEEHDIVYRAPPPPQAEAKPAPAPEIAPAGAGWRKTMSADTVLLFRYSALTLNGHRIHYDRAYAGDEEGYPGLVVHGPLLMTLLLELLAENVPGAKLAHLDYRAHSALYDIETFTLNGTSDGGTVRLWAAGPGERLAMSATATLG